MQKTTAIGFSEKDLLTNFLEANALRRETRKARELTKGTLGANIMMALSNYADIARTAVEHVMSETVHIV